MALAALKQDLTPFGEFLARLGITHSVAAAELKVTRAYVQMLATGAATPGLALAGVIEEWSRQIDPKRPVLMASWLPFCA